MRVLERAERSKTKQQSRVQLREGASVFTVIHMINGDVDTTGEYEGNNKVRHEDEISEKATRLYAHNDTSEEYNISVIRAEFRDGGECVLA